MKKYKILGLTGQTGAGKSTVSKVFAKNGTAVINADELVAELYMPDSVCLKILSAEFGSDIILPNKNLIHPFVLSLFLEKTEKLVNSDKKFIVFDAPQLFESKANVICDYIISVTADENIRKQRIMQRDGISEEMAESRINAQLSENYFKDNSDFILENNSTKQELIDKAEGLFGYIRQVI